MRIFFYLLIAVVIFLGITFALLNAAPVTFNYYLGAKAFPLSILLACSLVVGVLIGWFLSLQILIRTKRKQYALKSQLRKAEKK